MTLTAIIADDEPHARRRLRTFLAAVPWVRCVTEVPDGPAAVSALNEFKPDIVFLDIQMPGYSGLAVLERTTHTPVVIFTTAYDRYAVAAFELHALDYLLKPFGRQRFLVALERAREAVELRQAASNIERAREALSSERYLTRLFVRDRGKILPVPVASILQLEARDDYVAVHAAGHRHLIHMPMAELTRRLDPNQFLQVHRSHIVNLEQVLSMERYDGSRLLIELRDGTKILASRARSLAFGRSVL